MVRERPVDQTALSPTPPSGCLPRVSRPEPGPSESMREGLCSVGLNRSCPNGDGESLLAVPGARAATGTPAGKSGMLKELRARIHTLERGRHLLASPVSTTDSPGGGKGAWTLGAEALDRRLGAGLDTASLHEVKAEPRESGALAGAWGAAIGFALRLAVRRLCSVDTAQGASMHVLWCWPSFLARELGVPYGHGLVSMGIEPSAWLFAETARPADALWAMEEGLRSRSLALVVGILGEAELTPARRLSLAAAEHLTPCLIVTDPRLSPAGSTATRWRVGVRSSAQHARDTASPGAMRFGVSLERCRHRPLTGEPMPYLLEWSDETYRFRMAASVADRAHGPRAAVAHSG